MLRVVAGLLLCALVAVWAPALPQHVHASPDHAHPEHQHGVATHTHDHDDAHGQASPPAKTDGPERPHVNACSPDGHAIDAAVTMAVAGVDPPGAVLASSSVMLPEPVITPHVQRLRADVRVHGPPPDRQTPPRAPPPLIPA